MSQDAASLTLPKVGGEVRKIRIPRPPKFTRKQKIRMIICTIVIVLNIMSGVVWTLWGLAFTVYCVDQIYITFRIAQCWPRMPPLRELLFSACVGMLCLAICIADIVLDIIHLTILIVQNI